jgi:hypothetical protein
VVKIPSDIIIDIIEMTDTEGNPMEFIQDGKINTEFYFEFYLPGDKDYLVVSSELQPSGSYKLTNAIVEDNTLQFILDHNYYPFKGEGQLSYRQRDRILSDSFSSGYYEKWVEGSLPIMLEELKRA